MTSTEEIIRIDQELCTRCGTCADQCPVSALEGSRHQAYEVAQERCVRCGHCVQVCSAFDSLFDEPAGRRTARLLERTLPSRLGEPVFAAYDVNFLPEIEAALLERNLHTVVHCDSSVFAPLAEEFGRPDGAFKPGQVVAALRLLGFHRVYSNTLPAAISVLEQAKELSERVQNDGTLPMINSSCPAAIQFIEQEFPELLHHFAGCRSPRQIAGSIDKAHLARQLSISPEQLFSVSLTSCTAHKFEATRSELRNGQCRDIDAVLTTRELAWMLKAQGIDPAEMDSSEFDEQLPVVPEAASLFCHTGDVTRAVLQATAAMSHSPKVQYEPARSEGCITAFKVWAGDREYPAAAISGLTNAVPFLKAARDGKSNLRYLEIMACPQGCISGGGQPKVLLPQQREAVYARRGKASNGRADAAKTLAASTVVSGYYQNVFGKPVGDIFNSTLRTRYVERTDKFVQRGSGTSESES